jgi:hypothetical protein
MSVIGIGDFRKHGRAVAGKELEAINATQDFLFSEPVDISKYLDEDGECSRFENPATNEQIKQRKR